MKPKGSYRLLLMISLPVFLLAACSKSPYKVIIHLLPPGYEGPVLEKHGIDGAHPVLRSDSLFIRYDLKGVAYINKQDELLWHGKVPEYYFTATGESLILPPLNIDSASLRLGSCGVGRHFYSIVVKADTSNAIDYRNKQLNMINEHICLDSSLFIR